LYENSCFWDFSRNRLAGEEMPPGDSSAVSSRLPGDAWLCTKFLGFLDEAPGGVD